MGIRSIEFRAKRKANALWIYGDLYHLNDGRVTIRKDGELYPYEVIPETVGQYTGLTANGTKIFEGDIVTGLFDFEFSINAVVEFRDGAFGLLANQHDVEHFHPFTSLCNIEYEVIGNIHDNPELLKGAKEVEE